jgi:hypothetical protein
MRFAGFASQPSLVALLWLGGGIAIAAKPAEKPEWSMRTSVSESTGETTGFFKEPVVPPDSRPLLVTIESLRVSKQDLADLGFDWMLANRSADDSGAWLCGMFLKTQYAVVKRALNQSATPVIWSRETKWIRAGEVSVESRWAKQQPAFTLQLSGHSGEVEVKLKGLKSRPAGVVNFAMANVLLFDVPSAEKGMHELYFVTIDEAVRTPVVDQKPYIEIAVRLVQMPESVFIEHETDLRDAIRLNDGPRLESYAKQGLNLMNMPMVSMRDRQSATISLIREYRCPVEFVSGPENLLTPKSFESVNLGAEFSVTPQLLDDTVQLRGELTVRQFEGVAKGDLGTFAPVFQTTEANVFRVMKSGGAAGFWLPGVRTIRKTGDILGGVLGKNPDFQSPPNPAQAVRFKMGFMVTAKIVVPKPPVAAVRNDRDAMTKSAVQKSPP